MEEPPILPRFPVQTRVPSLSSYTRLILLAVLENQTEHMVSDFRFFSEAHAQETESIAESSVFIPLDPHNNKP